LNPDCFFIKSHTWSRNFRQTGSIHFEGNIFIRKSRKYIRLTSTDIITSSNIGYVTYADIGTKIFFVYSIEYAIHNCPLFRKTRINLKEKQLKTLKKNYDANTAIFHQHFVKIVPMSAYVTQPHHTCYSRG
jgi:hypothetical protein